MNRIIRPDAWSEIADAAHWYEGEEAGLGARFLDHLEAALKRICEHPYLYQEVDPEIRRARMHPFPYGIFYAVLDDAIHVLAFIDDRRDPAVWKKRVRDR